MLVGSFAWLFVIQLIIDIQSYHQINKLISKGACDKKFQIISKFIGKLIKVNVLYSLFDGYNNMMSPITIISNRILFIQYLRCLSEATKKGLI